MFSLVSLAVVGLVVGLGLGLDLGVVVGGGGVRLPSTSVAAANPHSVNPSKLVSEWIRLRPTVMLIFGVDVVVVFGSCLTYKYFKVVAMDSRVCVCGWVWSCGCVDGRRRGWF